MSWRNRGPAAVRAVKLAQVHACGRGKTGTAQHYRTRIYDVWAIDVQVEVAVGMHSDGVYTEGVYSEEWYAEGVYSREGGREGGRSGFSVQKYSNPT